MDIPKETIYLDRVNYYCHRTDNGTRIPYETDFFIGKCDTFVNGYYCIPLGESFTRSDGFVIRGEMIAPWKPFSELDAAQAQYERDMAELAAAYQEGVNSV